MVEEVVDSPAVTKVLEEILIIEVEEARTVDCSSVDVDSSVDVLSPILVLSELDSLVVVCISDVFGPASRDEGIMEDEDEKIEVVGDDNDDVNVSDVDVAILKPVETNVEEKISTREEEAEEDDITASELVGFELLILLLRVVVSSENEVEADAEAISVEFSAIVTETHNSTEEINFKFIVMSICFSFQFLTWVVRCFCVCE